MKKHKLTIPNDLTDRHFIQINDKNLTSKFTWSKKLIDNLIESNQFDVIYENFPPLFDIPSRRSRFLSFFKIDDILCAIDTWDSHGPSIDAKEEWIKADFFKDTKILFKIQKLNHNDKIWQEFEDYTGIITSNWTMFASNSYPLQSFNWLDNPNKQYYGIISGKRRKQWIEYFRNDPDFFTPPQIPVEKQTRTISNDRTSLEDFLKNIQNSLWGISLHGKKYKRLDCKNRREVEYTSCGIPLALNYKPEYPFPFIANEHYYYIENMEDVKNLKNIDPMPFHYKSLEVYDKYFSPKGNADILLNILKTKGLII